MTSNDGVADSGSAILYADGLYGVSYDTVPEIGQSRDGDPVELCLIEKPKDCPPDDERGFVYKATNKRTAQSWALSYSSHNCGRA